MDRDGVEYSLYIGDLRMYTGVLANRFIYIVYGIAK